MKLPISVAGVAPLLTLSVVVVLGVYAIESPETVYAAACPLIVPLVEKSRVLPVSSGSITVTEKA